MDVIDDITSAEAESMSKLFNNPTGPIIYSLSQELFDHVNELTAIEKKIALSNSILAKLNIQENQEQICKLKKEKKGFEEQKINLNLVIKGLEYIMGSVKYFTLFFIFIRRFYTLAIQRDNFENFSKNISAKLIGTLKDEEENLYNEFIDGDCFSKVLLGLSLETYQCYFKEYAKNFFDNIQHSSDSYVNSLLILKAIFFECTYFNTNNFNLTDLKFFLSQNIPINIPLPDNNYELVALRCFFFYELLLEYLKLKTVKTNLEHLKKTVNLELSIVNYKANTKDMLTYGLNDLQEALNKIEKKFSDFIEKKLEEDKETDVNKALVFYNKIEDETQAINKKTTNLINNKYINLTKMRRMLAIIVNEAHLPKFLELFNAKTANDFSLNKMGQPELIETNKEALNYLFHAICRDEFYTPLNTRINLFINEVTETCSKDDISVLDNIELEDLIEFSFYYIFTLLYTDFNASLTGFNSKLLYTEMITFNIFVNLKCKAVEILEKRINEEIHKFLKKDYKNKAEYSRHKQTILEEIKLNLEIIQDTKRILSDTKALEISLVPKLESSLVSFPEKNLLTELLKSIEKKKKEYELEYKKLEKHQFNNKSKSEKINKTNEAHLNKSIEYLSESLNCLLENLSGSLKHIKENIQDINQFRQKVSSALGQISSSIQRLSSSLGSWNHAKESHNLASLSLSKLLELAEDLIIKNNLIVRKDHKKKLTQLQELIKRSYLSIELLIDQVNPIIKKYRNCNNEAKNFLNKLSTSFIEDHSSSQFFSNSLTKNEKRQINGKLSNDYDNLKEKFNLLEKIIRIIKCDKNEQLIELCTLVIKAGEYQKAFNLFSDKIHLLNKSSDKLIGSKKIACPKFKATTSTIAEKTIDDLHSAESAATKIIISTDNLDEGSIQSLNTSILCEASDTDLETNNQENISLDEKSFVINSLPNDEQFGPDNKISAELEEWKNNFEVWRYEKQLQLYELFNIIENSTLSILHNGSCAFLKILAYYNHEVIAKKADLTFQKDRETFTNSQFFILFRKFLAINEKWLDETLNRMFLCIRRVEQSIHNNENLREISLRALLTEYFKISISYNHSLKNLADEEEKLSRFHINFTKQILPANSLKQMEEAGNMSEFSRQVDKVNQLKVAMELELKNKQEIIYKLRTIAPDWLNYVKLIDPLYTDNAAENRINFEPMQAAAQASPAPMISYGSSAAHLVTPATFYYLPPVVSPVDVIDQPHNPIFYSI